MHVFFAEDNEAIVLPCCDAVENSEEGVLVGGSVDTLEVKTVNSDLEVCGMVCVPVWVLYEDTENDVCVLDLKSVTATNGDNVEFIVGFKDSAGLIKVLSLDWAVGVILGWWEDVIWTDLSVACLLVVKLSDVVALKIVRNDGELDLKNVSNEMVFVDAWWSIVEVSLINEECVE